MNDPHSQDLPRLLYFGDVPVESAMAGSLLLHRLLGWYPVGKLEIWQPRAPNPDMALPNVRYKVRPILLKRLQSTRLSFWRGRVDLATSRFQAAVLAAATLRFRPEALLTVAHGETWAVADQLARLLHIPLHLICHDDTYAAQGDAAWRRFAESRFKQTYQRATSRLCVSSPMEREYRQRYGVDGTVLLPNRGSDCPLFADAPPQVSQPLTVPRVAYAGSLYGADSERVLRPLADVLARNQGRLLIYGPDKDYRKSMTVLDLPNVELRGKMSSKALVEAFRCEVDLLYLSMTFQEDMRTNMRLCFPSKLTDYTAAGLPILIHGPEDCAAVSWARENPGAAWVVTDPSPEALGKALHTLMSDPGLRQSLASEAMRVGAAQFSFSAARRVLVSALLQKKA